MKALLQILAFVLTGAAAQAGELKLVTEEYPPFSFREDGVYKGTSVDMISLVMQDAGLGYTMEMMPWARALALAETQPAYCVFTTVHNKERHDKFKWVEPLLTGRTILVRKEGAPVNPATLEEARAYSIGTQRADFTADMLRELGFAKVDLATDFNLTLKKLLLGRIDMMPISEKYYEKLKREGTKIDFALLLTIQTYGIACNKSIPDATISAMNVSLKKLIDNGTQKRLYTKYGLNAAGN